MALNLFCFFGRHMPRRSHMKWDGAHFVSDCRFCKSPIRKHKTGWQKIEGGDQPLATR
ncbi:hypothetical protein [Novosphingobium rosa]|uniref:hypothetical protein n=1 Tax=Novosphingobium rosa TaxID=76978 RepID=UPI000A576DE0|nr:hypothetical protein [Novosphingobium rosa]